MDISLEQVFQIVGEEHIKNWLLTREKSQLEYKLNEVFEELRGFRDARDEAVNKSHADEEAAAAEAEKE